MIESLVLLRPNMLVVVHVADNLCTAKLKRQVKNRAIIEWTLEYILNHTQILRTFSQSLLIIQDNIWKAEENNVPRQ